MKAPPGSGYQPGSASAHPIHDSDYRNTVLHRAMGPFLCTLIVTSTYSTHVLRFADQQKSPPTENSALS